MRERTLRGIDLISLLFAAVPTLVALVGLLQRPKVCMYFRDMQVPLPFGTWFVCSRAALFGTCVLPLALVVEGVVRKSTEAGQVVRSVVAILAGVGTLIAFASHLHFMSELNQVGY